MFIDELIQFCKRKSENIKLKAEPQVFIEIAGKLEELKALQHFESNYEHNLSVEYNKAIDEFAETLKEKYEEYNFHLCLKQNDYYSYSNSCMAFEYYVDDIAKQLKAGAE